MSHCEPAHESPCPCPGRRGKASGNLGDYGIEGALALALALALPLEGHAAESAYYSLNVSMQSAMRDPAFAEEASFFRDLMRLHGEYTAES